MIYIIPVVFRLGYFNLAASPIPRLRPSFLSFCLLRSSIMENGTQGEGKDPSSFLSEIIGNAVTVKLNSGVIYKGS